MKRALKSSHFDDDAAASSLISFCRSHVLYRSAVERYGLEATFSLNDIVRIAIEFYSRMKLSDSVIEQYASRILQWCVAAELINRNRTLYIVSSLTTGVSELTTSGTSNRRGRGYFLGDAPPERAEAALQDIILSGFGREKIISKYSEHVLATLCALGLTDNRASLIIKPNQKANELLRSATHINPSLKFVMDVVKSNPLTTGVQIGMLLLKNLNATWTEDTCNKNGNAIRRWVGWSWPDEFKWRGNGQNRRLYYKNNL